MEASRVDSDDEDDDIGGIDDDIGDIDDIEDDDAEDGARVPAAVEVHS